MDWNLVLIMVGIHAAMFLTPGPDSILIVSRATSQGMRYAFATILGVISAGLILVPAIAFGLDFVNSLSPAIWMGIRAAGAIYLMYLGYKMISAEFEKRQNGASGLKNKNFAYNEPLFVPYLQGLATNLGNPKMIVLLTSFLPQFVAPELGNVSTQILVLGLFMYLNGLICFSALAFTAILAKGQISKRLQSKNMSFWGGALAGSTMAGVGVWMLFAPINYLMTSRVR